LNKDKEKDLMNMVRTGAKTGRSMKPLDTKDGIK
jgi:hypothetical protein